MEIPIPIGLTIIGIVLFIVWQVYKRKIQRINEMPDIPQTLPVNGFEVPVLAAFTGLKESPRQVTQSHNNITPSLTLFEDRLECRVILKQKILYSDIEKVDIRDAIWTRNLHVYVQGKKSIFTANLLKDRNLAQILFFLKNKGILLSNRAKKYLSKNNM